MDTKRPLVGLHEAGSFAARTFSLLDGRRRRKEVASLGHEGSGNLASKMSLAACLIGKGVKNAERGWPETNAKPYSSGRLRLD